MASVFRRITRTSRGVVGRTAALAILACVLVLVVALGSSRSAARVGSSSGPVPWPNPAGDLFVVALAVCLAGATLIVYVLWPGRRRRRREPELVRVLPPVPLIDQLVAALLALAVLGGVIAALVFAARNNSGLGIEQPLPSSPETGILGPASGGPSSGDTFAIHWWLLIGVAIAVAGGAALLLARRRHVDVPERALRRPSGREGMRVAVEESLEEIAREADPRRAVIRAYVRMERMLAGHGLGRFPYEAPMEYLERALPAIHLSRASAERLTSLFVRARFSHHVVDLGLKEEAIVALTLVRDELQAAAE
ncbi:MAG: DUF4129 domain-containing protein [Armatimonadetes bacterium]|nr:DUF4129 domain-containing protein [Armatimonadota bacterium]